MPVRAVNLKIVVPRQPGHLNSAQALWATHDVVNRATKFYEQMLLLCRQQDYLTRDQAYSAADQLPELDGLIVAAFVMSNKLVNESPLTNRRHQ
jgi:hypothetical protein